MGAEVVSLPDADDDGAVCFYARLADGACVVARVSAGALQSIHDQAGPLGPTANRAGAIAFRARVGQGDASPPGEGVLLWRADQVLEVARTGPELAGFDGLPVVTDAGEVVFASTLSDGRQRIQRFTAGGIELVAETGQRFIELGRFPAATAANVVFAARTPTSSGIFGWTGGGIECLVDDGAGFEGFRGALIDEGGRVVFYATSRGGSLGIYSGPDPARDRVLGVGDELDGSTIEAFALNPVSINASGQLAVRLELADGRQLVVRADPTV
jgi:hypothetical protein